MRHQDATNILTNHNSGLHRTILKPLDCEVGIIFTQNAPVSMLLRGMDPRDAVTTRV